MGAAGCGCAGRAGARPGRQKAQRHVREGGPDRCRAELDRAVARGRTAVHAVGADPVLPRRGVRDDLRLYDHGFQHPPGGRVA